MCSCPTPFICEVEDDQFMCKHPCNSNEMIECGENGHCVYDLKGKSPRCQ